MGLSPIHSEWTLGGASSVGDVAAHYRTLGCNSMRIGFASSHTYDQSLDLAQEMGVDAFIEREIAPQLQAVLAQGMYAVVDLHRYFDDKSMPTMSVDARVEYLYRTIIPLWEHIARRYKDEPMIAMYELWNEPRWPGYDVGDVRQIPALRQWYLDAVRAVRRIDTRHIILVSDHNAGWGSGREQMWLAPGGTLIGVDSISPPRIAYSHHAAALSEQRGENERADEFARKHAVPVVYGEVELQPDVDSNDVLGAQQPMMLSRLVARLLANGLCQGWQGWRSGMDEWLDVWLPLTRTDHECRH
jgi:aryl-phospho-beta-D-glucosidase BglC (GH1 family)